LSCKLDIVIVNWNAGPLLRRCLESLEKSQDKDAFLASVTLVDNASDDGSADVEEERHPNLEVLRLEENIGYGRAANLGAGQGRADYLLFLNPDIVLKPDTLKRSLETMEKRRKAGAGILEIALLDPDGKVSRSCARFPSPWQQLGESLGLSRLLPGIAPPTIMVDWDHAESRWVDHVMGAFALMPRPLFEELGGFDPAYFVYWEDLDLSLRAQRAGAKSFYERGIEAGHKGGGTTQRLSMGQRLALALHARQVYARKHFGRLGYLAALVALWPAEFCARGLLALLKLSPQRIKAVLEAYRLRLTGRNPVTGKPMGESEGV
jgi:GT2 family glycosyltransferase